jgi:hypothetical protein
VVKHVAATYDGAMLQVYEDGGLVGAKSGLSGMLSSIDDSNNSIGQSQFATNPKLDATMYELRIYATALSAADSQASFEAGQTP